jgi:predicted HAD superfamily Cof-like phosphohydrolase
MKKDTLACVREFHESYGLPVAQGPNIDNDKVNGLRIELIREELEELTAALAARDLTEVLDALTDLQYVLDGAYLSFGLQGLKETAFIEVHRSNMSKLGADGKPVVRENDGKILKGPNYTPPDIQSIVEGWLKALPKKAA